MVAMAAVLYTIFLFDLYALRIYVVAKEFNPPFNSYDFLKICTFGLIINSPVKGLNMIMLREYSLILWQEQPQQSLE